MALAFVKSPGAATVESRFHALFSTTRVFAAIGGALTILTIGTGVYFVASRTGGDIYHRSPVVEQSAPADAEKTEAERKAETDRIAAIESNPHPSLDACNLENQKVVAIDMAAVDAGRQLQKLQGEFVCPASQTAAKEAAKTFGERTRTAQSELARIGCYRGPVNGELDDRTRTSMTSYLVAHGAAGGEARLTDEFLSELTQQGQGLCSIARLPHKEEPSIVTPRPTPEIKPPRPPVEPSTRQRRPRAHQPVERPEERVPEPSWHRKRKIEPAETPPQHASRPIHATAPARATHTAGPASSPPPAPSPPGRTTTMRGIGF